MQWVELQFERSYSVAGRIDERAGFHGDKRRRKIGKSVVEQQNRRIGRSHLHNEIGRGAFARVE